MPPTPVEVANSLLVYDANTDSFKACKWNIFTEPGTNKNAAINISTAGTHIIISPPAGKKILITTIFFTVASEVNITLYNGQDAITGAMDFGGSGEPKGIVINFGDHGLQLSEGLTFRIQLSANAQVSGLVNYILLD